MNNIKSIILIIGIIIIPIITADGISSNKRSDDGEDSDYHKECYSKIEESCSDPAGSTQASKECSSRYGGFHDSIQNAFNRYIRLHLDISHKYLIISTNFAAYDKNRDGFKKLFRELSDHTWEQAFNLIKYITKRGGIVDLNAPATPLIIERPKASKDLLMTEIGSVAAAVEITKQLANEASHIHREVTKNHDKHHDPEICSYIEENFVEYFSKKIRELVGYTNDLESLLASQDYSIGLYMFNDYLLKQ